ncbi:MAG: ParB N-terminal domain-containing protein [Planctomycetales bacterium]
MTVTDRHRQRVVLPRSGPDLFWQRIRAHFSGDDPARWKALVMFALRVDCGWPLELIGHAFGHTKGHVLRCLRDLRNELRHTFAPPDDWFHGSERPDSHDDRSAEPPSLSGRGRGRVNGSDSSAADPPPTPPGKGGESSAPHRKGPAMIDLRRISIDCLKPAPYNPRVPLKPGMPGYRRLERSLAEFDLVQPIVWNERTGHVVAGHQRLEILKNKGEPEVDVSVVSLSLEREKALNVVLNNPQVGSDWEMDQLTELVAELDALPDFDATLTGFDDDDLRALLMEPVPDLPPDDAGDESQSPHVRVTLEVPPARWEAVRPDLDDLLAEHELTLHVKMPRD